MMRADARRNRDRVLEVAVRAFSRDGDHAALDAIAKEAGLGIGTLYRHFPTREALIDAVVAAGGPAQRDQARRLLDLIMDGLRYRDPAGGRRHPHTADARRHPHTEPAGA